MRILEQEYSAVTYNLEKFEGDDDLKYINLYQMRFKVTVISAGV